MKNKNQKPDMYINKNNGFLLVPSAKKISDSFVITDSNKTPLCRIDLTCFDEKAEPYQIARFKQVISFLTETGII